MICWLLETFREWRGFSLAAVKEYARTRQVSFSLSESHPAGAYRCQAIAYTRLNTLAITIYRAAGARLGEANSLLSLGALLLGALLKDPAQAMAQFEAAQQIFIEIGDRYNQGRNLLLFIAPRQV